MSVSDHVAQGATGAVLVGGWATWVADIQLFLLILATGAPILYWGLKTYLLWRDRDEPPD